MVSSVHCFIGLLVAPAYCCLTIIALLSPLVPFLRDLASHGKTLEEGRTSHHFPHVETLQVHKRFFVHFYVAGLIAMTIFISTADPSGMSWHHHHQWLEMTLLILHLGRRCYECLFVHCYSSNSRMHLAGYICGIVHYLFLPFMLFESSSIMCVGDVDHVTRTSIRSIHSLMGVGVCLWAQFEQYQHHCLLASLRPASANTTTDTTNKETTINHKIPRGRFFRYVSCPHYLAEIAIYGSLWFLLFQDTTCTTTKTHICRDRFLSIVSLLFQRQSNTGTIPEATVHVLLKMHQWRQCVLFLWVASNLTVTAVRCHGWYLKTFPTYHQLQRKAIIPGVL